MVSSALRGPGAMGRMSCLSVPVALACRNLIASTVAQMTVQRYRDLEELPAGALLSQPDPSSTWSATISRTVEDLLLFGQAAWIVLATDGVATDTNPRGLPVRARYVPFEEVEVLYSDNLASYQIVEGYLVNGHRVELADLIHFDAGHDGVLAYGARTLATAIEVEEAARRFSTVELPAGVLYAEGHELGPEEAAELVEAFTQARQSRSVALLQHARYERVQLSPDELALGDMKANSDREIARLFGVPVAMVAASPSGNSGSTLTYANITSNTTALVQTAVAPVIAALEQTLSLPSVTPRGQRVKFDVAAWLRSDPSSSMDYAIQLSMAGILSQEEARSFLGLGPAGTTTPSLTPGKV
jgi:HK97 family phage portal protein